MERALLVFLEVVGLQVLLIGFLHGFYASGQCVPAVALREAFAESAEVITPDLPMLPKDVIPHFVISMITPLMQI